MSRHDRPDLIPPSASRRMNIGTANSARDDFHINVIVAKGLGFELELRFVSAYGIGSGVGRETDFVSLWTVPLVRRGNGKAFESFGIHFVDSSVVSLRKRDSRGMEKLLSQLMFVLDSNTPTTMTNTTKAEQHILDLFFSHTKTHCQA